MDKKYQENIFLDTRCWGNVLEGIEYTFKSWVRDAVEDVISEKMCNVNLEDKRLTVEELCKRWNICKNTLHNWEKKGIIQPLPLKGKKNLYSMEDILTAEENGNINISSYVKSNN